jgi:hypothetical protein
MSQHEFASFLHNPFGYPNKIQKAGILAFQRAERFGFSNINDKLDKVILSFFGNLNELYSTGLSIQYNKLKQYVIDNNLVALIIYGADLSKDDRHYHNYTRADNNIIPLNRHSICIRLIKEYIGDDDETLNNYCKKTPNFNIYYTHPEMITR